MKMLRINSLESGWADRDEIMLHACFQLLTDYVEKEKCFERINWDSDDKHKEVASEIRSLYHWWVIERPKREDPILTIENDKIPPWDELWKDCENGYKEYVSPDKEKYKEWFEACERSNELEIQWNEEDQRNLHRLIEIRGFLWT